MIGIDEVGRGCWAGPLLVVAVRGVGALPTGLADSKQLTKKRREALVNDIKIACDIGEGWVTPLEIDTEGLAGAMRLGVARALAATQTGSDEEIIMDGKSNYCDQAFTNVQCVVKADALYPLVSAASVYAKVKRDALMADQAQAFPEYGFEKHVGYGTALHMSALKAHGVSAIHRRSFRPISELLVA